MTIATRRWKGRTASKATQATQQDRHSLTLEYDIFVNVRQLDAKDTKNVKRIYIAEDSDSLTGRTLDLGALQVGQPPSHHGPRRCFDGTDSPAKNDEINDPIARHRMYNRRQPRYFCVEQGGNVVCQPAFSQLFSPLESGARKRRTSEARSREQSPILRAPISWMPSSW